MRRNLILSLIGVALFVGGVVTGFWAREEWRPLPSHVYRTVKPLPLADATGRAVGFLPAKTVVFSKYGPSKGETGWWGFVAVSFGDATDAAQMLERSPAAESKWSLEQMLVAGRGAP